VSGPIKIAIIGDGSKAKKEAKDVGDTYKSVFSKLGDSVRVGVSKSFGGLRASASSGVGDLLGAVKGLPALAVGAAVGGSLVVGFTKAMDLEDARGLLQAQLGLTAPESAKAGKIAGDLYKQAYGDSIQDVNETLKTVFQSGLAGIGDSATKIEGVTQSAFTLSKVMGEETLPITRAVAQMLKTGLAKNAKEAFDLLTRGQQLGINKSEDLLDTFNEYGTQFRKLGLSGSDALGLINQLLQGGARDSDVAADAIKEFSIRAIDGSTTTAQGFKAIGLNAKEMAKQIGAGGPAARTAFGQVLTALNGIEDPVKRNLAGVALFGTQWEDLGGAIGKANLGTAAKSLGDVAGATARANDATTTTSTKLSQVARTIQFTLTDAIAKYALPKLNEFVTWFQGPGSSRSSSGESTPASRCSGSSTRCSVGCRRRSRRCRSSPLSACWLPPAWSRSPTRARRSRWSSRPGTWTSGASRRRRASGRPGPSCRAGVTRSARRRPGSSSRPTSPTWTRRSPRRATS
jgi:phage-related minor tail protein